MLKPEAKPDENLRLMRNVNILFFVFQNGRIPTLNKEKLYCIWDLGVDSPLDTGAR